jgi:hypothetical protein
MRITATLCFLLKRNGIMGATIRIERIRNFKGKG